MTQLTWVGTRRIVNGAVVLNVTEVRREPLEREVEREVPIPMFRAGDQ